MGNMTVKLSLFILAQNEERRLPRTLQAVAPLADEIVLIDSGSTDRTVEIAEQFGARVIYHPWKDVGDQVKFGQDQCSNDWLLRLDADEVLTPELQQEIRKIKEHPDCDGYKLRICDVFPGTRPNRWVKHYKLIRLYNRRKFTMAGRIGHDDVDPLVPHATSRVLHGLVAHYSQLSISHTVGKYNLATDRRVNECERKGVHYSPWRMVGALSGNFLRVYFLDRFFLLGWWGFIHSVRIGHMRFLKFAKWYERGHSAGWFDS